MATTFGGISTVRRRVFPSWSLVLPEDMAETFVPEGGYWHASAADRSVSLSSIQVREGGRPVPAHRIVEAMPPGDEGEPVAKMPPGVAGWAVTRDAPQPALASRVLSGMLAIDGHVAIVTITCDDMSWALDLWLSIRPHPCSVRPARSAGAALHVRGRSTRHR